jgi:serine/threonine protein kinase
MHDEGICHRDLKVTNLLVNRFKHLKLIDYGFGTFFINKKLGETSSVRRRLDLYCGTPSYMAPEMIVMRVKRKMEDKKAKGEEYSSELSSLIETYKHEF